jgi:hypothetical protein
MPALDIMDRELWPGDFVVFYNNIYQVKETPLRNGYGMVKIMSIDPSPTTKPVKKYSREMCRLDKDEVLIWLLKQGHSPADSAIDR